MNDLVPVSTPEKSVALSVFDMTPRGKISHFTEMADILRDIIRKQNMFSNIQGKDYVKVEGWITLGTLIGILPREKSVVETEDGSYIAEVELINFATGMVVGGASALCSIDESRWKKADKYARRSMAVTRATGKAYRISFAWVMSMAGYEGTPAEEMPTFEINVKTEAAKETKSQPIKVKPQPVEEVYDGTLEQETALATYLEGRGINSAYYETIGEKMKGKPKRMINEVIAQVVQ